MTSLLQENESLRSTVELLNIRLSSLNEIISIQETELLKFQTKFSKGVSDHDNDVLTKWREKLFALLVQLKSQEIVHEKENRNGRAQVRDYYINLLAYTVMGMDVGSGLVMFLGPVLLKEKCFIQLEGSSNYLSVSTFDRL